MKNNKDEKGVTLIALSITIIVMLIIAGIIIKEVILEESELIPGLSNETYYQENMVEIENEKMDNVLSNQLEDWGF